VWKARGQNAPSTYNVTRHPTLVKGIGDEMRTECDLAENAVTVLNTQSHRRHPQTRRCKAALDHTY